jgi:hypothetical protein
MRPARLLGTLGHADGLLRARAPAPTAPFVLPRSTPAEAALANAAMTKHYSLVQPYGTGRNRQNYQHATVLSNHATAAEAFAAVERIAQQLQAYGLDRTTRRSWWSMTRAGRCPECCRDRMARAFVVGGSASRGGGLPGRLSRGRRDRGSQGTALSKLRPRMPSHRAAARATGGPGDSQAPGARGGSPAGDVLPHVPGDEHHGVPLERRDARACAADCHPRVSEDHGSCTTEPRTRSRSMKSNASGSWSCHSGGPRSETRDRRRAETRG